MADKIAIIGGSGFDTLPFLKNPKTRKVSTKFGDVEFVVGTNFDREVIFLLRHGTGYSLMPSKINYCANISALAQEKVCAILATATIGSLNASLKPADLVLLSDFMDFTSRREKTLFSNEEPVYTDMSQAYHPDLRAKILRAAKKLKVNLHPGGVYICTEGPRFETPAEIKMYRKLGADVVGMTQVPEVVLASEAKIPYAALGIVTNWAAGISKNKITTAEILKFADQAKNEVFKIFEEIIKGF